MAFPVPSASKLPRAPYAAQRRRDCVIHESGRARACSARRSASPAVTRRASRSVGVLLRSPRRASCEVASARPDWLRGRAATPAVVRRATRTTLSVRPARRPVDEPDDSRRHVDLDVRRGSCFELDPVAEWRQMFEETVAPDARQLLARRHGRRRLGGGAATATGRCSSASPRTTISLDVLWEVIGELDTLARLRRYRRPRPGDTSAAVGKLGANLVARPGRRLADRRASCPASRRDPERPLPARRAGIVRRGRRHLAVGGRPVDPASAGLRCSAAAGGKTVELTIPAGDGRGSDAGAGGRGAARQRGRRCATRTGSPGRRARRSASVGGGRLGYLHIPDMMGVGLGAVPPGPAHEVTRTRRLIVDVRYNRGGHTRQLVIEKLARRRSAGPWRNGPRELRDVPDNVPRGPVVCRHQRERRLDGDIVNAAAAGARDRSGGRRAHLGRRGRDRRSLDLVDGTVVTQPRFAFWLQGKEWGVENHGVDPDIEVEIAPAELLDEAESDRQLDRAIEEALRRASRRSRPPVPRRCRRPRSARHADPRQDLSDRVSAAARAG